MGSGQPVAAHRGRRLSAAPTLIEARGLKRSFGGTRALDDVDFDLGAGRICALLGENGAGKSTLARLLCGHLAADAGEIRFLGQVVCWRSPAEARRAGLAMVHQHFMLVPTMTIAENLALARGGLAFQTPAKRAKEARAIAAQVGFDLGDPSRRIEDIAVGEQQRVEILKALLPLPRLLVLDEPTAVLAPDEVVALFDLLRRLAADGVGIILVTHKLTEALGLADELVVLRHGRLVKRGLRATFDAHGLAGAMIGEAAQAGDTVSPVTAPSPHAGARVSPATALSPRVGGPSADGIALRARGLCVKDRSGAIRVADLDLDLHAGRICGIAGIEGNGQAELVAALLGVLPARTRGGTVEICGQPIANPAAARAAGLALVPADRLRDGLVGPLPLRENLMIEISRLGEVARRGWINLGASTRWARQLLRGREVRPADPELSANALSGGNQQRLVVARELDRSGLSVVLAVQPTRGLDLLASRRVHERIRQLADEGVAVLVISSDLDEVLELADLLFVMLGGRLQKVSDGQDRRLMVGRLMAGLGAVA